MDLPEFQASVLLSLAKLETNMESLVGNGQPGRMSKIEDKVDLLEDSISSLRTRQSWWNGLLIGISTTFSAIIHFVFRY